MSKNSDIKQARMWRAEVAELRRRKKAVPTSTMTFFVDWIAARDEILVSEGICSPGADAESKVLAIISYLESEPAK